MDEEGIGAGCNFMAAIGDAIKQSQALIAIVDTKFTTSTYCLNEIASKLSFPLSTPTNPPTHMHFALVAQGNGLQFYPIMFRGLGFADLPASMQVQ
jgi:hypothetical protein